MNARIDRRRSSAAVYRTAGVEKLEFQLNSFFNQKPPNFLIMPSC